MFRPDDEKQSIYKTLDEDIKEYGLSNLSYEVTYKGNGLLSFNIFSEGCGAYCSSRRTYFNFDLKTGKKLSITDLILENKLDSFYKIAFADKVKYLREYKEEELNMLKQGDVDSATYDWALEQVDSNCMKDVKLEDFSFSTLNLEINDSCEFPHAIRSQQPTYELKYTYTFLSAFLTPRFKKIFLKKGESREVVFEISEEQLKFFNSDLKWVSEPGEFHLFIGTSSENVKKAIFHLRN